MATVVTTMTTTTTTTTTTPTMAETQPLRMDTAMLEFIPINVSDNDSGSDSDSEADTATGSAASAGSKRRRGSLASSKSKQPAKKHHPDTKSSGDSIGNNRRSRAKRNKHRDPLQQAFAECSELYVRALTLIHQHTYDSALRIFEQLHDKEYIWDEDVNDTLVLQLRLLICSNHALLAADVGANNALELINKALVQQRHQQRANSTAEPSSGSSSEADSVSPLSSDLLIRAGQLMERQGNRGAARQLYEQCLGPLKLDDAHSATSRAGLIQPRPSQWLALDRLCRLLGDIGDFDGCRQLVKSAQRFGLHTNYMDSVMDALEALDPQNLQNEVAFSVAALKKSIAVQDRLASLGLAGSLVRSYSPSVSAGSNSFSAVENVQIEPLVCEISPTMSWMELIKRLINVQQQLSTENVHGHGPLFNRLVDIRLIAHNNQQSSDNAEASTVTTLTSASTSTSEIQSTGTSVTASGSGQSAGVDDDTDQPQQQGGDTAKKAGAYATTTPRRTSGRFTEKQQQQQQQQQVDANNEEMDDIIVVASGPHRLSMRSSVTPSTSSSTIVNTVHELQKLFEEAELTVSDPLAADITERLDGCTLPLLMQFRKSRPLPAQPSALIQRSSSNNAVLLSDQQRQIQPQTVSESASSDSAWPEPQFIGDDQQLMNVIRNGSPQPIDMWLIKLLSVLLVPDESCSNANSKWLQLRWSRAFVALMAHTAYNVSGYILDNLALSSVDIGHEINDGYQRHIEQLREMVLPLVELLLEIEDDSKSQAIQAIVTALLWHLPPRIYAHNDINSQRSDDICQLNARVARIRVALTARCNDVTSTLADLADLFTAFTACSSDVELPNCTLLPSLSAAAIQSFKAGLVAQAGVCAVNQWQSEGNFAQTEHTIGPLLYSSYPVAATASLNDATRTAEQVSSTDVTDGLRDLLHHGSPLARVQLAAMLRSTSSPDHLVLARWIELDALIAAFNAGAYENPLDVQHCLDAVVEALAALPATFTSSSWSSIGDAALPPVDLIGRLGSGAFTLWTFLVGHFHEFGSLRSNIINKIDTSIVRLSVFIAHCVYCCLILLQRNNGQLQQDDWKLLASCLTAIHAELGSGKKINLCNGDSGRFLKLCISMYMTAPVPLDTVFDEVNQCVSCLYDTYVGGLDSNVYTIPADHECDAVDFSIEAAHAAIPLLDHIMSARLADGVTVVPNEQKAVLEEAIRAVDSCPPKSASIMAGIVRNRAIIQQYLESDFDMSVFVRVLGGSRYRVPTLATADLRHRFTGNESMAAYPRVHFLYAAATHFSFRARVRASLSRAISDIEDVVKHYQEHLEICCSDLDAWVLLGCAMVDLAGELLVQKTAEVRRNKQRVAQLHRRALLCFMQYFLAIKPASPSSKKPLKKFSEWPSELPKLPSQLETVSAINVWHELGSLLMACVSQPVAMSPFYTQRTASTATIVSWVNKLMTKLDSSPADAESNAHIYVPSSLCWPLRPTIEQVCQLAASCFKADIRLNPTEWRSRYMLGKALSKLGNHAEALACYVAALQNTAQNENTIECASMAIKTIAKCVDRDGAALPARFVTAIMNKIGSIIKPNSSMTTGATPEIAASVLANGTSSDMMTAASTLDKTVLGLQLVSLLNAARSLDKRHWHHRHTYLLAFIKSRWLGDHTAARTEMLSLLSIGTPQDKRLLSLFYKPEHERPGKHYDHIHRYVLFTAELLRKTRSIDMMQTLIRKMQRSDATLLIAPTVAQIKVSMEMTLMLKELVFDCVAVIDAKHLEHIVLANVQCSGSVSMFMSAAIEELMRGLQRDIQLYLALSSSLLNTSIFVPSDGVSDVVQRKEQMAVYLLLQVVSFRTSNNHLTSTLCHELDTLIAAQFAHLLLMYDVPAKVALATTTGELSQIIPSQPSNVGGNDTIHLEFAPVPRNELVKGGSILAKRLQTSITNAIQAHAQAQAQARAQAAAATQAAVQQPATQSSNVTETS